MKPSTFTNKPFNSVFSNDEHEVVAKNIMVILERTNNTFRNLTWEEYSKERASDGNFSTSEKKYFDSVVSWCTSSFEAINFSPVWAKAAKEELT